MERPPSALRALAAAVGSWVACGVLTSLAVDGAVSPTDPESVVAVAAISAGALAALVLACGCTALTAAGVVRLLGGTGRRLEAVGARLTPAVVRRALAVSLGAGLGLGLGPAAVADELDIGWQPTAVDAAGRTLDDGTPPSVAPPPVAEPPVAQPPVAQPPVAQPPVAQPPVAQPAVVVPVGTSAPTSDGAQASSGGADDGDGAPEGDGTHVVVAGDSLWSIAAAHLPDDATDAEVARAWPRWWTENRDVVGPDPDVIHPGQTLRLPDGASS